MNRWNLILIGLCVVLPVFASTSMREGIAHYRAGNYHQAKHFFSQGNSAEEYYNLGNTYVKLQEYTLALQAYDKALRLKPDFTDAKFNYKLIRELYHQELGWMLSVQHLIDDPSGFLYLHANLLTCAECLYL